MSFQIKGFPTMASLPDSPVWSAQRGAMAVVQRWRGPREDAVSLLYSMQGQCAVLRLEDDSGGYATVVAEFDTLPTLPAPTELPGPRWDLQGNDLEKDLFTHPEFEAMDSDQRELLRKVRADAVNADRSEIDPTGAPADFLNLILLGTQSYTISQYVLRATIAVPGTFNPAVPITALNVGKVYEDNADLIVAEAIPALPFALPAGMWLKRTPVWTQQDGRRWQYVQEWWHATTWSARLYTRV